LAQAAQSHLQHQKADIRVSAPRPRCSLRAWPGMFGASRVCLLFAFVGASAEESGDAPDCQAFAQSQACEVIWTEDSCKADASCTWGGRCMYIKTAPHNVITVAHQALNTALNLCPAQDNQQSCNSEYCKFTNYCQEDKDKLENHAELGTLFKRRAKCNDASPCPEECSFYNDRCSTPAGWELLAYHQCNCSEADSSSKDHCPSNDPKDGDDSKGTAAGAILAACGVAPFLLAVAAGASAMVL